VAEPPVEQAFLVFAQRTDARIEIAAWNGHAVRFFATRIGLTADPRYAEGQPPPTRDEAEFVIAPNGEPPGMRRAFARPADAVDRALAEAADARAGDTGLALLARRCKMVWLVSRDGPHDLLALRLSAILASVLLGPILDATAQELFGVKTARAKLESRAARA
jgi:hypothetical protein